MFSRIKFINLGKFKSSNYKALFNDYIDRLKHYTNVEVIEIKIIKDEPGYYQKVKDKILSHLKGTKLIIFSEYGKLYKSIDLADYLKKNMNEFSVIVGASWGLPEYILEKANLDIAFGHLTLPHEAVRVLASEQFYRACTIINGEKYHK